MVTVKSATYGDENNSTDVTKSVSGNFKDGRADFAVDDSIVPLLITSEKAELDDDEKADIKGEATRECGGNANDTQCMQATVNRISQSKLQDKIDNEKRVGNIKGPRLTATIIDERGREKTIIVPKGQSLRYGVPPKPCCEEESTYAKWSRRLGPAIKRIAIILGPGLGLLVGVILWAFSIGATWRAFIQEGYTKPAYVATAAAILFPLSGFVITPVFYAFLKYFAQRNNA